MSDFSQRLTGLREAKGLSKAETARRLGIPASTYSNYEYGNREPDLNTLKAIANYYHVATDYLLNNDLEDNAGRTPEKVHQAVSHLIKYKDYMITDHDREIMSQLLEVYLSGQANGNRPN